MTKRFIVAHAATTRHCMQDLRLKYAQYAFGKMMDKTTMMRVSHEAVPMES